MTDLGIGLQGGSLANVPPGSSQQSQIAALNEVINRLNSLLKSQIFSDGNTKRMLIGFQENGWGTGQNFGIKISIDGVDVTKATDAQLLFKMDLQTWTWYDADTNLAKTIIGYQENGF